MKYTHAISEALRAARDKLAKLTAEVPDVSESKREGIRAAAGAFDHDDVIRNMVRTDSIATKPLNDTQADASPTPHNSAPTTPAQPLDPQVDLYHRVLANVTPDSVLFVEKLLAELGKQGNRGHVSAEILRELTGKQELNRMTKNLNERFNAEATRDELAEHRAVSGGWRLILSHQFDAGHKRVTDYSLANGAFDPLTAALAMFKGSG
ncbi:hypothetical protein [Nocardia altamirensis]|uniref:hypothetical protein n=1 Tax=Nocardia altamirensis TaxID=472158 RepID=UPI0008407E85|nr:hypothetical protein [Nocardia altamirensis]